ncbi:MAG: methionyl-tRNA formyltransferase [Terrimicrobiaceae bacterium]
MSESKNLRVVFLGTGEIGLPSLGWLLAQESIEVAAVVTQPDRPSGRHLQLTPPPVKVVAEAAGVPVFQPARLRAEESLNELVGFSADLFIVVAYGQILSARALAIPRLGCLNIHASVLPRHRGASPIQSAILSGDQTTGVTIMWMDEGLDTGDILLTHECAILASDTAGKLHDRLAEMAPAALREALDCIREGQAPRIPQDDSLATHSRKISRQDGLVDWFLTAEEIHRRFRAYSPWPGSFSLLPDGRRLIVREAVCGPSLGLEPGTVAPLQESGLPVAAGAGSLMLQQVQVEGGRPMTAGEFVCGHGDLVGKRLKAQVPRLGADFGGAPVG